METNHLPASPAPPDDRLRSRYGRGHGKHKHIMDPTSGYPARNGLISVTVISDEGLYCDALSTALFVMGPDEAAAFWRSHRDFEMILATEDAKILITPGLTDRFTQSDDAYTVKILADTE